MAHIIFHVLAIYGIVAGSLSALVVSALLLGPVLNRTITHRRRVRRHGPARAHLMRAMDRASV
jgi:hypothetical protein